MTVSHQKKKSSNRDTSVPEMLIAVVFCFARDTVSLKITVLPGEILP